MCNIKQRKTYETTQITEQPTQTHKHKKHTQTSRNHKNNEKTHTNKNNNINKDITNERTNKNIEYRQHISTNNEQQNN